MKNEARRHVKQLFRLWMLLTAALFASSADALVLGDIQVNSYLGQPLNAKIAFVDISDVDISQLKVHLADAEAYRKLGLHYPENIRFAFKLVSEPGALAPFIRVLTSGPIDDPFVDLLVEISSPLGTLTRDYTFLLDPARDGFQGVEAPSAAAVPEAVPAAQKPALSASSDSAAPAGGHRRIASKHKRAKNNSRRALYAPVQDDGKPHMKLAMSLSISRYDPSMPVSPKENSDALQEELIAKEKSLEDLKLQIGEMQGVIKSLQGKLEPSEQAESAVPEAAPAVKPPVEVPAPAPAPAPAQTSSWLNPLLFVLALVLTGAVFVWYRKYRQMHAWQHGAFEEEVPEEPKEAPEPFNEPRLKAPSHYVKPAPMPSEKAVEQEARPEKPDLSFERSSELPAYAESVSAVSVPPEYTILLEANKYMRSGKEELAEAALLRAIGVNPKNPYGYQALLKIYSARNDKASFANIAGKLKENADAAIFEEAAELGRKLDPGNPLYE